MNVPDDWGCYYSKCSRCGSRTHASEGGCNCEERFAECAGCMAKPAWVRRFWDENDEYVPINTALEVDGKYYCETHAVCECCDKPEDEVGELEHIPGDIVSLYCVACREDKHNCPEDETVLDYIVKATAPE